MRQLFRWAILRQPWRALLVEGNIADLIELKQVTPAGYSPSLRQRVLTAQEIRELRDVFERLRSAYEESEDRRSADRPMKRETELALWLCLSTACRIGELLKARWEDVDLATGEWVVPKENTKTNVEWRVYLSSFALAKFQELRLLTQGSPWCFPARPERSTGKGGASAHGHVDVKTVSKQIGDRQMMFKDRKPLKNRRNDNSLVLAGGANGAWTPHDLRRTAATMMQQLGVLPDVIDRCQNHVLAGSKVRRHYLHHDYAEEKRAAWSKLGQRLQEIIGEPPAAHDTPELQTGVTADVRA
ncbi:MAG: site-specific integrase [Aquincola sp.]|nr:site-specific integrase [Aquincola sp.]